MASALHIGDDNRILSAWKVLPNGNYECMPIVETLPEGNIADYLYVNGEYVYEPLPETDSPPHAPSDSERITILEQQMTALMGGVADVQ